MGNDFILDLAQDFKCIGTLFSPPLYFIIRFFLRLKHIKNSYHFLKMFFFQRRAETNQNFSLGLIYRAPGKVSSYFYLKQILGSKLCFQTMVPILKLNSGAWSVLKSHIIIV